VSEILEWAKRERERAMAYVNPPGQHIPVISMQEKQWFAILDALIAREEALLAVKQFDDELGLFTSPGGDPLALDAILEQVGLALAVDPRPKT